MFSGSLHNGHIPFTIFFLKPLDFQTPILNQAKPAISFFAAFSIIIIIIIIIRVFCSKTGPSLQAEKPRLQFCPRQVFHRKLRNQGCSFTRDFLGAKASRCFPHPTLSLASEQTLKDLKRSQGHQLGGEKSGFG